MPKTASPPRPALDNELATRLRLAVMRLARRLRQEAAEADVTPSMLSALSSIEHLQPITLGELAVAERVQPPTVTRAVAALEVAGLVVRIADERDRRVARVSLTRSGERFIARNRIRKNAYLAKRMSKLGPEETSRLSDAVEVIEKMLEDRS